MSGVAPVNPTFQFLDAYGNPLASGTLTVYAAGTTTLTDTWQDRALTSLNTNPIVLNAAGRCTMWLDPSVTYKFLLKDVNGLTQSGYPVDNVPGSGGSAALMNFTQAGTGAIARTMQDKTREIEVSAADFSGFDSTGATDSSAAVASAIASLPSGGGIVTIPRGTPRFNVTITKSGVKLRGAGMSHDRSWSSASNYVRPWTNASPCIQVGNDTGLVVGVSIEDMTVYGATTGTIGVYWAGGCFRCGMRNVSAYEFTTNNFKFKGGATYPCSLIFGNTVISQSTVAGNEGVLVDGNVATYTSAIYFIGAHLSVNGASSHALAVDNCDSVFMSNSYIDAANLKGIVFRKSGSVTPRINASNFSIDSAANTDILVEVPTGIYSSVRPSEWIRGVYTLDGKMTDGVTTVGPMTGGDAMLFTPLLRGPKVDGPVYFPDPTTDANWYNDVSASISATGAGSSRQMTITSYRTSINSSGASQNVRFAAGGTNVFAVDTYAILPLADATYNAGDSALRFNYGYIKTLRPGAGSAQWTSGSGSPEGVLAAAIGSLYTRTDGGASTTLYVKESGAGNTGWVAK